MRIEVTKENLYNGRWNDEEGCPIVLALQRYVKEDTHIYLDFDILGFWHYDTKEYISEKPNKELIDIMKTMPNKPFSINIDIPAEFLVPQENRNASSGFRSLLRRLL